MKLGNVILAIFFFLCIPGALVAGGLFGIIGGGGPVCMVIAPLLFFSLGAITLIMGSEDKKKTAAKPNHSNYIHSHRRCNNCGRVIPEDALRCPYCPVNYSNETKTALKTKDDHNNENMDSDNTMKWKETDDIKHCIYCGKQVSSNAYFCAFCGKKIGVD